MIALRHERSLNDFPPLAPRSVLQIAHRFSQTDEWANREKVAAKDQGRWEAEAKSQADYLPKKQQGTNQADRKEDKASFARPDSALAAAKLADEDGLSDDAAAPQVVLVLASAQCKRQAAIVFPRVL